MTRHRSVLEELRPPGGWWQQPSPADVATVPADTCNTAVDVQPDGTTAGPSGHNQSDSTTAGEIQAGPPETKISAPKRRAGQTTVNEQRFGREREATQWMDDAACQGCDPALFFPERGESTAEAKAVCASCPVQPQCLEHALQAGEKFGTWGGKSYRGRRHILRERRRAGRAAPSDERLGGAA